MPSTIPASRLFSTGGPRILLTDTNRWPVAARLALAFRNLGCEIAVLCRTPHHPVEKISGIQSIFRYNGNRPIDSLKRAMGEFTPDIVVPSCDRGVHHLHELHAISRSGVPTNSKITGLIERSLGAPGGFGIASSRSELLKLAQSEGILVPQVMTVRCQADLDLWSAQSARPWVMKADGTWGGQGVRLVNDAAEAKQFFFEFTQRGSLPALLKKLLCNRDWDWLRFDWLHSRRSVIAQSCIIGRPANCAVVCWQGKVLAGIAVEVIQSRGVAGPATVVQVVPGKAMIEAAEKIAQRLGISGFFGLDFMIEEETGDAYLIEMNPRCTPPCQLALGGGRNLVAAFWSRLTGKPIPEDLPVIGHRIIAYFPAAVERSSSAGELCGEDSVFHDVPEDEPELIRELLHPWSGRSPIGQLVDQIWRKQGADVAPTAVFKDAHGFRDGIYIRGSALGSPSQ